MVVAVAAGSSSTEIGLFPSPIRVRLLALDSLSQSFNRRPSEQSLRGLLPPFVESLQQTIALWLSMVASFVKVADTIRTESIVTTLTAFAFSFAALIGVCVQRGRVFAPALAMFIGDRSLDSLNAANLRRRVTDDVFIQDAHHTAVINDDSLSFVWNYTGYAVGKQVSTIVLSIDSDSNVPFDALDCVAYDLRSDPGLSHQITPILIGQDGLSKKIAVPFINPISAGERFAIRLECRLPNCMKFGIEYYTCTLSFNQHFVPTCTVQMRFLGTRPRWVRLYQLGAGSELQIIKDLRPISETAGLVEYSDIAWNLKGSSTAVYAFDRGKSVTDPR